MFDKASTSCLPFLKPAGCHHQRWASAAGEVGTVLSKIRPTAQWDKTQELTQTHKRIDRVLPRDTNRTKQEWDSKQEPHLLRFLSCVTDTVCHCQSEGHLTVMGAYGQCHESCVCANWQCSCDLRGNACWWGSISRLPRYLVICSRQFLSLATLDNLVISNQLWQISRRLPAPAISSDSIKRKNFVITLGASIQLTQCCSTICFQIAY